jgi:hypothetical protein
MRHAVEDNPMGVGSMDGIDDQYPDTPASRFNWRIRREGSIKRSMVTNTPV